MKRKEAVQEVLRAMEEINGRAVISALIAIGIIEKIDCIEEEKERDIEELEVF